MRMHPPRFIDQPVRAGAILRKTRREDWQRSEGPTLQRRETNVAHNKKGILSPRGRRGFHIGIGATRLLVVGLSRLRQSQREWLAQWPHRRPCVGKTDMAQGLLRQSKPATEDTLWR
jgi:hypothetical protein